MALTINYNPMAMNTARSLNQHFGMLSTSTQRLSSGLRINSSADDAAGLAIRELQRSEIRTLKQGARNANDAVSMLQTMDGGLAIIDEKLIRMKELAEQAATGTYDSTQRLMINDEFQAMKSEIDRIASSTDFNNIKLLSPDIENKLILAQKMDLSIYYGGNQDIFRYGMLIDSETKIINKEAITAPVDNLQFDTSAQLVKYSGDDNIKNWIGYGNAKGTYDFYYDSAIDKWSLLNGTNPGEPFEFYVINGSETGFSVEGFSDATMTTRTSYNLFSGPFFQEMNVPEFALTKDTNISVDFFDGWRTTDGLESYPNAKILNVTQNIADINGISSTIADIDLNGDGNADIVHKLSQSPDGLGHNGSRIALNRLKFNAEFIAASKIHFGTSNDSAEDYYYIDTKDCTARGLGIDRAAIDTQDAAQNNLTTLNSAIVKKDNARAYFGSMQNRLENTISNLNIQAENLQASESRISDTDVGIEMTEMVKNQILSQSATAMLAQANSIPKMALQLIGG